MYSSSLNTGRRQVLYQGTNTSDDNRNPFAGNLFCDTNLVEPKKLEYNDEPLAGMRTTGSRVFIRILPTRDDYHPDQLAPPTHQSSTLGQWFRGYEMFMGGVLKQVKLILWDPNDPSYSFMTNPALILRNNILRAVKEQRGEPGWETLVFSGQKLGAMRQAVTSLGIRPNSPAGNTSDTEDGASKFWAPLASNRRMYFARSLILQRGLNLVRPIQGLNPADKISMLVMSPSAGKALATDVAEHGYDFQFEGGTFHVIFRQGDNPYKDDKLLGDFGKGYEVIRCGFEFPCRGTDFPNADLSAYADVLFEKLVPWKDVIYIYEDEVQARYLAEAFPYPVLAYGWREHAHLLAIANEVHHRTTTVEIPGSVPAVLPQRLSQPIPHAQQYEDERQSLAYGQQEHAHPIQRSVKIPPATTLIPPPLAVPRTTGIGTTAIPQPGSLPSGHQAIAAPIPQSVPAPQIAQPTGPLRQQWQPPVPTAPTPGVPVPPAIMPGNPSNTQAVRDMLATAYAAIRGEPTQQ